MSLNLLDLGYAPGVMGTWVPPAGVRAGDAAGPIRVLGTKSGATAELPAGALSGFNLGIC